MKNIISTVILRNKTHKGKNIISNYGDTWLVIREKDQVLFSGEKGPWICCVPLKHPSVVKSRWVHSTNDEDFEVEKNV